MLRSGAVPPGPAPEQPPAATAHALASADDAAAAFSADDPALPDGGSGFTSSATSAQQAAQDMDIKSLRRKAKEACWEQACILPLGGNHDLAGSARSSHSSAKPLLRPVLGTPTSTLGIYGVGVQLYFELLVMMGAVYAVRGVVTMPMLILNTMGTGISDFISTRYLSFSARWLSSTFLANIGSCPAEGCHGDTRRLLVAPDAFTPLTDVAPWLGGLEALASLLNAGFCFFFALYWIPRTVAKQDDQCVTAADFSVFVSNLPGNLAGDHAAYEDTLHRHFVALLRELGVEGPHVVQRVTLVRHYDGALTQLLKQGRLHVQAENDLVLAELARQSGDTARAKRIEARSARLQEQIASIETLIARCKSKSDLDRDVCGAFIMFDREEYKDMVLEAYSRSRSCWARPCQDASLRFGASRIRVAQAAEPADLKWENLDYPRFKGSMRRCGIRCPAAAMIWLLLFCLVLFRSSARMMFSLDGRDMWVLQPVHKATPLCARLCNLSLALGDDCSTNVPIISAWDSDGAVTVDLTTSCWQSDVCTKTAPGEPQGWLGVQTDNLSSVLECVSFQQDTDGAESAMGFQVFGCYSELMATHGIDEACVRMADLFVDAPDDDKDARGGRKGSYNLRLDTSCGYDVSLITAEYATGQGAEIGDQARQCFCQQKASKSLYMPFSHDDDEMCEAWLHHEDSVIVRSFFSMLAVMTLNLVMLFFFTRMEIAARYTTETEAVQGGFYNIYWTQLLNTGIVFLVAGMNLQGSALPSVLQRVFNLGEGEHTDINRSWFVDTGMTLLVAIVCEAVVVISMPVFTEAVLNPFKIWWSERGCVTEDTLRTLYELPEWQMPLRLAETMTVVTCVEMYAGFMPVLYWVGACYCFLAYWVDKWTLLAKSKRPFSVGEAPAQFAADILTIAAMIHIVMTLWVLGTEILPSDWGPLTPLGEFFTRMTREESVDILKRPDGKHESVKEFRHFLRARIMTCTHASCTGLLLAAIICIVHIAFVVMREVAKQIDIADAVSRNMKQTRIARWIRSWGLARRRSNPTTQGFADASNEARQHRVLFSYRLQDNDRYTDVCRALHLDVELGSTSLSSSLSSKLSQSVIAPTVVGRVTQSDFDDAVERAYNLGLTTALRAAERIGLPSGTRSSSGSSSSSAKGFGPAQGETREVLDHPGQGSDGHCGKDEPKQEQGLASAQCPTHAPELPSGEGDVVAVPRSLSGRFKRSVVL